MKQLELLGGSLSNEFPLIKDYCEYTAKFSESPQVFHLFTLFSTVACLIGRNRWCQQGEDTIFPNLYVLIVAPSSLFMKSSCTGLMRKWLNRLQHMDGWIGHVGSPEGLFNALQSGKGAIGYYSELGVLLSQATGKKYMSDILEMLNDLYDSPEYYSKRLSQGLRVAKDVCLNILAASQMDSLSQYVKESALLSGFLPRFAIVFSDQRRPHMVKRPPPDTKLQNSVLGHLARIRKNCNEAPGPMHLTPTAWETFETWAHDQWEGALVAAPQLQPMYGRMESHVLKLATIIELTRCDYSTEIDQISLEAALDMAEFMAQGYRKLVMEELTFSLNERKLKKVSNIIKAAGEISNRDLTNSLGYVSKELQLLTQTLVDGGKIKAAKGPRGGKAWKWL